MESFDWHYIGRFGQLGPLSQDQMVELIDEGVIQSETYVWRQGMGEWARAASISSFSSRFTGANAPAIPPPSPGQETNPPPMLPTQAPHVPYQRFGGDSMALVPYSSRSRVAGGVLNLIFPGLGRLYMGYIGVGLLQFFLTGCFGAGYLWSFVDGVLILTGNTKADGTGRPFKD